MQIYEYLKQDHFELKQLLNELVEIKDNDDFRFVVIEEIRNLLVPHARAEESVFYNTLRAVKADGSLVRHGFKEHLEAETLLRTLQVMDRFNLEWKGVALKLKTGIERHIEEEETEIFAEAKNIFTHEEAEGIGAAFISLKPQIQKEGFFKNSFDLVVNLLPPRIADKIRSIDVGGSFH